MPDQLASVDYQYALAAGALDMLQKLEASISHKQTYLHLNQTFPDAIGTVEFLVDAFRLEVARLKEEKKRAAEGGA